MNSTPALSSACRTARSFALVIEVWLSANSARRIVVMPTAEAFARSAALQRISARAARSWALVNALLLAVDVFIAYGMFHSIWGKWSPLLEVQMETKTGAPLGQARREYIGGSDARMIMGDDFEGLVRLWREKRAEGEPLDLSDNLAVQLGSVTEDLNRLWFKRNIGHEITKVQHHIRHPVLSFLGATLDGVVEATGAIFEAKFMLPWSFSEEAAAQKHMA